MQINGDSMTIILNAKPPLVEGFKSIAQIIRRDQPGSFAELVDILARNGRIASNCPILGGVDKNRAARFVLSFDGQRCFSSLVTHDGDDIVLDDATTCSFPTLHTSRPCA